MKNLFYNTLIAFIVVCKLTPNAIIHAKEPAKHLTALPFYKSADFTPHWLDPKSDEARKFHRISDFSFTNQAGESVSNASINNPRGKPSRFGSTSLCEAGY